MKVVFIGAGNIATSFAAAFEQQGHTVTQIWSRTLDSARQLVERLTSGRNILATNCLSDLQTDADLYLLAVRDGVMADTAERLAQVFAQHNATFSPQRLFVHLACTQTLDVLRPLHSFGHTGVLYPFQAFSKTRIVDLSRVAFFTEGDSEESSTMVHDLALSFSPTVYTATFEQRVYLHLSGCIANNFTNCLYAIAKEVLDEARLPFDVLYPVMEETAHKAQLLPPREVQSGPAARGDSVTIEKHLALLDRLATPTMKDTSSPIDFRDVYRFFTHNIQAAAKR